MVRNEKRLEVIPVSSFGALDKLIANLRLIQIRWITAELDPESHLYSFIEKCSNPVERANLELCRPLLKTRDGAGVQFSGAPT
jgi:hypothetical protein